MKIITIIVMILVLSGCGHHYYSSDDPKTDQGPRWYPDYIPGIGPVECYQDPRDPLGVKHCRPRY